MLISGGAGYIGSHTCLELLRCGHEIHVVDNLYSGNLEALERVRRLSNRDLNFTECDIRDSDALNKVFIDFQPYAVIHFAGLKAVAESIMEPSRYYDVNVGGTAVLLSAMDKVGCRNIVFSSSATVYGEPKYLPCDENHPLDPTNPYGRTKLMGELLLKDWSGANAEKRAVALRYFNPVGADVSGLIGENPNGIPNNLMPVIAQVAIGRLDRLQIFGNDYETVDGTAVRDYIHVVDLASAHVAALEKIGGLKSFEAINIGTGQGISVLEMVREFERQTGQSIKFEIAPRRPGDATTVWADSSKAADKLAFQARRGAAEMCIDTWRWQRANPNGYLKN